MIREFHSDPFSDWGNTKTDWNGKLAVDLKWVAAAQPTSVLAGSAAEGSVTAILLAGSQQWQIIDIRYDDFMTLWLAEKKGNVDG